MNNNAKLREAYQQYRIKSFKEDLPVNYENAIAIMRTHLAGSRISDSEVRKYLHKDTDIDARMAFGKSMRGVPPPRPETSMSNSVDEMLGL